MMCADFYTGNNIERVIVPLVKCPQTGIQHIMIGDGDHIQSAVFGDIIQDLFGSRQSITGIRMHMDIGSPV